MSFAEDNEDGNRLQLEKLRLNFPSCFRASSNNRYCNYPVFFSLCEVRLYLPLHVQRKCSEWMKLAVVLGQNLRDPCDIAPLCMEKYAKTVGQLCKLRNLLKFIMPAGHISIHSKLKYQIKL